MVGCLHTYIACVYWDLALYPGPTEKIALGTRLTGTKPVGCYTNVGGMFTIQKLDDASFWHGLLVMSTSYFHMYITSRSGIASFT